MLQQVDRRIKVYGAATASAASAARIGPHLEERLAASVSTTWGDDVDVDAVAVDLFGRRGRERVHPRLRRPVAVRAIIGSCTADDEMDADREPGFMGGRAST